MSLCFQKIILQGSELLTFKLKTEETLRLALAQWLLQVDRHNICCEGNELGQEFVDSFRLPKQEETLLETFVDEDESITLVFESAVRLDARSTVSGKPAVFTILRYVRVLYDDEGNVYGHVTLGYSF